MTTTLTPIDAGDYMTTEALARHLGVRPKTLHNWRYQGKGPAYVKQGGVVRYHRDAIRAWRYQHEVATSA